MSDPLVNTISNFFKQSGLQGPFLLGYSGGVDSKALLYMLLEAQKSLEFSFAVAHVDHGLREESGEEERAIAEEIKKLGLPYYCYKIDAKFEKNLEDCARKFRLEFFKKICKENQYQAVLLAHQADDVAETTLKRVFEGARILKISGIQPITNIDGLRIARPLLSIWKSHLRQWLQSKQLEPFEDPTNFGRENLRAKMRGDLFPFLEESFGKNIKKNLHALSIKARELSLYLHDKLSPMFEKIQKGPWGSFIDCRDSHSVELQYFLPKWLSNEGIAICSAELDSIIHWIRENSGNKALEKSTHRISVDRGYVFLMAKNEPVGDWKVIALPEESVKVPLPTWKELWLGEAKITIPSSAVCREVDPSDQFKKKNLGKYWSEKKVPHFFKNFGLVISENSQIIAELLSGTASADLFSNNQSTFLLRFETHKGTSS